MSAGDARSAFLFHATDVARNDKRRLPGASPRNDRWVNLLLRGMATIKNPLIGGFLFETKSNDFSSKHLSRPCPV